MSNLAPQVEVPFSALIQRQFVLVFVVYQPVQCCALQLFHERQFRSSSFDFHLFVSQSTQLLHCFVDDFSPLFLCQLGIRRLFPAKAMCALRWDCFDDFCANARFVRIAHFSRALAPVHLLAHDRICKKGAEKYQCGGFHQASLATPVGDAVSAVFPSSAHQRPSACLAAPAAVGQGVEPSLKPAGAAHEKRSAGAAPAGLSIVPDGNHGDHRTNP